MATLIPALGACVSRMTAGERRLAERLEHKLDDDYQRFFEQVCCLADDLPLLGQLAYAILVAAQGQALVQAALKLAAQFAQRPVLIGGLDFVKAAFIRFFDGQQENVVGPAEGKWAFRLSRHCLDNLKWLRAKLIGQTGSDLFYGQSSAYHRSEFCSCLLIFHEG